MDLFSYLLGARNSGGGGNKIQYDVIPTPDETTLGKIIQYTGETTETYINGYFYIGVSDNEENPTYSWEQLDVQPLQDLSNYELLSNKVNSITSESTNTQYPGAKAVYDLISGLNGDNTPKRWTQDRYDINNRIDFDIWETGFYIPNNIGQSSINTSPNNPVGVILGDMLFINYFKDIQELRDNPTTNATMFAYGIRLSPYEENNANFNFITFSWNGTSSQLITINTVNFDNGHNMSFINELSQTIKGVKTFNSIPKIATNLSPTNNLELVNKQYVDNLIASYSGYDATKTQVLKNVNGTLTWVDE